MILSKSMIVEKFKEEWNRTKKRISFWLSLCYGLSTCRYICIYAQTCRYAHNRMIFPRSTTLTEEFSTFQLSSSWLNKNCLRLNLFIFLSSLSSWVTFYPPRQIFNIPRLTMRRSTKMLSGFSARMMKVHFKKVVSKDIFLVQLEVKNTLWIVKIFYRIFQCGLQMYLRSWIRKTKVWFGQIFSKLDCKYIFTKWHCSAPSWL